MVWKGTGRYDENAEAAVVTASVGSASVAAICQLGAELVVDPGAGLLAQGAPVTATVSSTDGSSPLCNATQLFALKHNSRYLSSAEILASGGDLADVPNPGSVHAFAIGVRFARPNSIGTVVPLLVAPGAFTLFLNPLGQPPLLGRCERLGAGHGSGTGGPVEGGGGDGCCRWQRLR